MRKKLVIISGLPGTGKSTLAHALAVYFQWPLLCIDDLIGDLPDKADTSFWDSRIAILLDVVERQLSVGLSVIVDSVFMNKDRDHTRALANRYRFDFIPVYMYLSNEYIWEERVTSRFNDLKLSGVATWDRIQTQRNGFRDWEPGTALFIDSVDRFETNVQSVVDYIETENNTLKPMMDMPLVAGKYHD